MTKYLETFNVQPTTTKTIFVAGGTFSWAPQNNKLADAGVVEVSKEKKQRETPRDLKEKRAPKK
jgi:hypothetical protein